MKKSLKNLRLVQDETWSNFLSFREKRMQGARTGIDILDNYLLGLSGIVGIQGEPGSCKSTLALQIASHNAQKGTPVVIIDRENGENRFRQRLMSQLNKVSGHEIMTCSENTLKKYYNSMKSLPIFVDSSYQMSLELIHDYADEALQEFQKPILLVVDSLQALPKSKEDERMALQHWMEGLDQIKLDFKGNVTILMTSEKSRGKYEVATKEGGKGTGSIEFKCEQLLDLREIKGSSLIAASVVKNRDGTCSQDILLSKNLQTQDARSFTFLLNQASAEQLAKLSSDKEDL